MPATVAITQSDRMAGAIDEALGYLDLRELVREHTGFSIHRLCFLWAGSLAGGRFCGVWCPDTARLATNLA